MAAVLFLRFAVAGRYCFQTLLSNLYELPTKAAFDTQVTVRHGMIEGRSDAHNLVFLRVNRQRAADAAIRADRIRVCLL